MTTLDEDFDAVCLENKRLLQEIETLKAHQAKLTDDEINDAWKQSHEDGIAMQQGFTSQQHYFAHLILRKAQNG